MKLASLTTDEVRSLVTGARAVALVPVGSVEPHGPHLPLGTDTVIGEEACARAAASLAARGVNAVVAPSVPYGVTDCAAGFAGAVTMPAAALTAFLAAVATGLRATGFAHVCLVNNHLEAAHDAAVRAAAAASGASVACPLTRRWARTLSDEFKRGDCHAGRYETSLALAADVELDDAYRALAPLDVTLVGADGKTFQELGMARAYTGAPADATREEGEALYEKLVTMIVTEVEEALARPSAGS